MSVLPWILAAVFFVAWVLERWRRRMTENDLHFAREATGRVRHDWLEECARNRRLRYGIAPFLAWSQDVVSEFGPQSDAREMAEGGLTVGACRRLVAAVDAESGMEMKP